MTLEDLARKLANYGVSALLVVVAVSLIWIWSKAVAGVA